MKPLHIIGFLCAIPVEIAAVLVFAWWRGNREAQEQQREYWRYQTLVQAGRVVERREAQVSDD